MSRYSLSRYSFAVVVQTLVFLMLVFTGQATIYIVREHHHLWASMDSPWMITGTVADIVIVCVLATTGTLMTAISWVVTVVLFGRTRVDRPGLAAWCGSRRRSWSDSATKAPYGWLVQHA